METSYVNSDGDMGEAHIISHAKQHDYLMSGEQEIIVLSNTKLEDKSQDLALQKAIEQGVKTEDEWKEYNSKLMPSRQKKSYQEYIKSLSNNYTKNIQRQLDKGTLTSAKKDKNYQSLKAIERNGGLAVEGNLYYLGNVDDYENKSDIELKKYREFQAKTLERFYHSDIFKMLNKGCFRAEIHQDEKGATHLQTQNVNYHTNSRGRVEMATGACQKEALIELYGSEEELNKRLDLLQAAHNANDKYKKNGAFRTDAVFWHNQKSIGKLKPATAGKRRMRIPELYRMEQMHELTRIALDTAKQYNIGYKVTRKYTTDGVHKTATAYTIEKKVKKHAKKTVATADRIANETVAHADKIAQEKMNELNRQQRQFELERDKLVADKKEFEKQKIEQNKQLMLLKRRERVQNEREAAWPEKAKDIVNKAINEFLQRNDLKKWLKQRWLEIERARNDKYYSPTERQERVDERVDRINRYTLRKVETGVKNFAKYAVKRHKEDDGLDL